MSQTRPKLPAAKARPNKLLKFGDLRFDFVVSMKHDLRINNCSHYTKASLKATEGTVRGNCPMCRLVTSETKVFFEEEKIEKERARRDGLLRGVQMRIRLLHGWARNQASLISNSPSSPPLVEVVSV